MLGAEGDEWDPERGGREGAKAVEARGLGDRLPGSGDGNGRG